MCRAPVVPALLAGESLTVDDIFGRAAAGQLATAEAAAAEEPETLAAEDVDARRADPAEAVELKADPIAGAFARRLLNPFMERLRADGLLPIPMIPERCEARFVDGCGFHAVVLETAYQFENVANVQLSKERLLQAPVAGGPSDSNGRQLPAAEPLFGLVLALHIAGRPKARLVVPYVCRGTAALVPLSRWVLEAKDGEMLTVLAGFGGGGARAGRTSALLFPDSPEELSLPLEANTAAADALLRGGAETDIQPQLVEVPQTGAEWPVVGDARAAGLLQTALAELQDADWAARAKGDAERREDGPLARGVVLLQGSCARDSAEAFTLALPPMTSLRLADGVLEGGLFGGGRKRMPRTRWHELLLQTPSSWEALEQQLALLVEQASWELRGDDESMGPSEPARPATRSRGQRTHTPRASAAL